MTDVFTEQLPHNEGFIVSEAPGSLSREQVTIITGAAVLHPGTVMGVRDDGKYQQLDPDSSEGNDAAVGILCSRVDSTAGDVAGVVLERLAEVNADELIWPDGITTVQQATATAELLARDIKLRSQASTTSTQTT